MITDNSIVINQLNEKINDDKSWLSINIKSRIAEHIWKKVTSPENKHDYYLFCLVFAKLRQVLDNVAKKILINSGVSKMGGRKR